MRRTLVAYIAMLFLSTLGIASAQNPDECKKELLKALNKESNQEKLKELNKRVKKCPNHDLTLIATAKLYAEMGKEADPDWLRIAIKHYQAVVDLSTTYQGTARWGLASLLEYAGEYELAIPHYQWIIEQGRGKGIDEKRIGEARAHLITCKFVMKNAKRPASKVAAQADGSVDAERLDFSDTSIKERAGWGFLKEFVASVAVAGGMAAPKGEGSQILVALGLLYDWSQAPQGEKVEARNRFLAGMISTMATIIAEKKLGVKLGGNSLPSSGGKVEDIPEGGYAGSAEDEFRTQQPQEGRTFEISDDLTIVEKWDVPDISGQWILRTFSHQCNLNLPAAGSPNITTVVSIQQEGTRVTMLVSGYNPIRNANTTTAITGQIRGSTVTLNYAESNARASSASAKYELIADNNGRLMHGNCESSFCCTSTYTSLNCTYQIEMVRK